MEDAETESVDLIRRALQEHLKRLQVLDPEERDRLGYEAQPQRDEDFRVWEDAAAWPENRAAAMFTLPIRADSAASHLTTVTVAPNAVTVSQERLGRRARLSAGRMHEVCLPERAGTRSPLRPRWPAPLASNTPRGIRRQGLPPHERGP
jgi:hypothetical protein